MTHTLHRRGDAAGLHKDYVVLVMPARGINLDGAQEKMRRVWEIVERFRDKVVNFGNLTDGNSHKTGLTAFKDGRSRLIHVVFTDEAAVRACLAALKEAEVGISVVVSGLSDRVAELCREVGLKPHTVNHSLGVHGDVGRLPEEPVLELTTMCGHAMVSANLVRHLVAQVRAGKMTRPAAAVEMSRLCECGVFNPARAEELLVRLVGE